MASLVYWKTEVWTGNPCSLFTICPLCCFSVSPLVWTFVLYVDQCKQRDTAGFTNAKSADMNFRPCSYPFTLTLTVQFYWHKDRPLGGVLSTCFKLSTLPVLILPRRLCNGGHSSVCLSQKFWFDFNVPSPLIGRNLQQDQTHVERLACWTEKEEKGEDKGQNRYVIQIHSFQ